jgi:hypothetical protein
MRFIALFILFPFIGLFGQEQLQVGQYSFDGDDVVYRFDKRAYAAVAKAGDSTLVLDFQDLQLIEATQGDVKGWNKEGWALRRVGDHVYELRKPLGAFRDSLAWNLRYVLHDLAPQKNLKRSQQGTLGNIDLNNPNVPKAQENTEGNAVFHLKGHSAAKKVILTGTFNQWDEHALAMHRDGDGWTMRLALKAGRYEYKFIVDGAWMEDPANPETVQNEHATLNSVLSIRKPVKFFLKGFLQAQSIVLSGGFNNWDERAVTMTKTAEGWEAEVPLTGGKHEYKYIVDGEWVLDPANPMTETTWNGYINSIKIVR